MVLVDVTPPAVLPVSLGEFKGWLRMTDDHQDKDLTDCLVNATDLVEKVTRRALIEQTLELRLDNLPSGLFGEPWCPPWPNGSLSLDLPRPPLASITSVITVSPDGSLVTMDADKYEVVISKTDKGRIVRVLPSSNVSLKQCSAAVRIRFVAGYGPDSDDVPMPLRTAIKTLAASLFETRGAVADPGYANRIVSTVAPGYRITEFP